MVFRKGGVKRRHFKFLAKLSIDAWWETDLSREKIRRANIGSTKVINMIKMILITKRWFLRILSWASLIAALNTLILSLEPWDKPYFLKQKSVHRAAIFGGKTSLLDSIFSPSPRLIAKNYRYDYDGIMGLIIFHSFTMWGLMVARLKILSK